MHTNLNEIKQHNPCSSGWKRLLTSLNKAEADNEILLFKDILESNGIEDAIWSLRVLGDDNRVRVFAGKCAEHVLYLFEEEYPDDVRPRKAVEAALCGEYNDAAANAAADAAAAYAATYAADAADAAADAYAADAADAAADAYAADAAIYAAIYAADAACTRRKEREWQTQLFIRTFCTQ